MSEPTAYKLTGRYAERTSPWIRGKVGRQAKKRVYTTLEDFNKYAPETAERYHTFCKYDVEFYHQVDGKWIQFKPDWWDK